MGPIASEPTAEAEVVTGAEDVIGAANVVLVKVVVHITGTAALCGTVLVTSHDFECTLVFAAGDDESACDTAVKVVDGMLPGLNTGTDTIEAME